MIKAEINGEGTNEINFDRLIHRIFRVKILTVMKEISSMQPIRQISDGNKRYTPCEFGCQTNVSSRIGDRMLAHIVGHQKIEKMRHYYGIHS